MAGVFLSADDTKHAIGGTLNIGSPVIPAHSIGGTQSSSSAPAPDQGIGAALKKVREMWELRLFEIFPEPEGGVLCDLLLGDKKAISGEIKDLYTRNGIAHILSISGVQTRFSTYPFILQALFYGISQGYIPNSYIGSRRYLAKCNQIYRRQGYNNLA